MKNLAVLALALAVCVGCSTGPPSGSSTSGSSSEDCAEPENPYSAGSGHFAGYEWAESNNPSICGGNSSSFIEGCETFQQQEAAYEACLN
jgi:hypothetical protein